MNIIDLIKELIKFYWANGNLGIVRWKQYEGFVFIYNDFLVLDSNTIQVRNHLYSPSYCFNEHIECRVRKYIWELFKMFLKFGNVNVVMYWNENSGTLPRNGILPLKNIDLIEKDGDNYCELS
jgi:hypothetical protein